MKTRKPKSFHLHCFVAIAFETVWLNRKRLLLVNIKNYHLKINWEKLITALIDTQHIVAFLTIDNVNIELNLRQSRTLKSLRVHFNEWSLMFINRYYI